MLFPVSFLILGMSSSIRLFLFCVCSSFSAPFVLSEVFFFVCSVSRVFHSPDSSSHATECDRRRKEWKEEQSSRVSKFFICLPCTTDDSESSFLGASLVSSFPTPSARGSTASVHLFPYFLSCTQWGDHQERKIVSCILQLYLSLSFLFLSLTCLLLLIFTSQWLMLVLTTHKPKERSGHVFRCPGEEEVEDGSPFCPATPLYVFRRLLLPLLLPPPRPLINAEWKRQTIHEGDKGRGHLSMIEIKGMRMVLVSSSSSAKEESNGQ